jgi:hypothetical protein
MLSLATLCVAVITALTLGVGTANAGLLGCGYKTYTQPFQAWGDRAHYVPVAGGSFESAAAGWTLAGGARVVAGNEPFALGAAGDANSLLLPPGSSAITPGVCLQILTPSLRFVGYSSDGSGVRVTMYTRTVLGLLQVATPATMNLSTDWNPSEIQYFLLQNVLGLLNLDRSNIYFKFTPTGGATVQLDDVFLDPSFME